MKIYEAIKETDKVQVIYCLLSEEEFLTRKLNN